MADNVDVSIKLGTEADIGSAINAGARAGAAFAAAAQSAVSGLQIGGVSAFRTLATSNRIASTDKSIEPKILIQLLLSVIRP